MGQNPIDGECWYRQKLILDLLFIPDHFQNYKSFVFVFLRIRNKGKMGQFMIKAQKSYIYKIIKHNILNNSAKSC